MAEVSIRQADSADDVEAARALCREWLDWHWRVYPPDWPRGADHPMNPEKFEETLGHLPELHAPPRGAILVAWLDGQPAGCVMYHEAAPGVAEFKRMYVSEAARGHAIGRRMLERMFDQMIVDGYRKVFFSSATFLTHARAMYERAGFVDMPHPSGFPPSWRDYVYFMERPLV